MTTRPTPHALVRTRLRFGARTHALIGALLLSGLAVCGVTPAHAQVTVTRVFTSEAATAAALAASDAEISNDPLVQRGAYLARAGDCIACHTSKTGKPFAGGLPIETPIGTIYSTNITPSKIDGIGNYSITQFSDALRRGKRADGAQLYPAMPYTSYAKLSDSDINALYAYFMHGVAPVNARPRETALPFPFNVRLSMAAWNLLFLDTHPFTPDASKSAEWNRGAYLVEGLAHCSTCHTPRNFLMAEDTSRALSGGYAGAWYSPNLTSDTNSGLGGWSQAELAQYLRTGTAPGKAQAAGPMAEAIDHSFSHLTDDDLKAMATYIKSVAPIHDAADTQAPFSWGSPLKDADSVRGQAWPADVNKLSGAQLYDAFCASCHQAKGEGSPDGGLPSLFHNTAVGRANTDNLVMAILTGVQRGPESKGVDMPAFGHQLTDQQIATLGNFLVQQYGNPAATVSVEQVRTLRAGGAPSSLLTLARVGMALGVVVVLLILWLIVRARSRRRVR